MIFALWLNPVLQILEQKLPGIRIGRRSSNTAMVVYADNVTITVTAAEGKPAIKEAIRCYEMASGVCLNNRNYKALEVGAWNTTVNIADIPYDNELKLLGFKIRRTMEHSANISWSQVTGRVRAQALEEYDKDLCLTQKIHYVHAYNSWPKSETRHISYRPIHQCIPQLVSAEIWYIWQGAKFRVKLSPLQRWKDNGGWDFRDVAAKCRALLSRLWIQGKGRCPLRRRGSITGISCGPERTPMLG